MNSIITASTTLTSSIPTIQKTTKVILVRHGRTTYNEQGRYQGSSDESVLTEKGHYTAYQTGLALQQFKFDAIYTSPLTRVRQTTQAITSALKATNNNFLPVFIDHKLTEISMSEWEGLYYQEPREKFPEAYRCWQETPHLFRTNQNIFPVLELFKKAQQFWQEVLNKHRGQTILVVAHSGTNRALISTAIGLSPEYYHSIQQSNCGISCVEFPDESRTYGKLKYLNVTNHIEKRLPKLKAGKTGWRWLLLSNKTSENSFKSSYLQEFLNQGVADLILTDDTKESESLTTHIGESINKSVHLSMTQDHFLDSWQKTIFAKQQLKINSNQASLVTGLIIASDQLLSQILHKTLDIKTSLDTINQLSIIHYPHANRQSILQGMLPINQQLADCLAAKC